jgi:hypothetical protein
MIKNTHGVATAYEMRNAKIYLEEIFVNFSDKKLYTACMCKRVLYKTDYFMATQAVSTPVLKSEA